MKRILERLRGSKTNLISAILAILSMLQGIGLIHIDPAKLQALLVLLGAGAAASLHAAIVRQSCNVTAAAKDAAEVA